MAQITVNTSPNPYAVICQRGALERVGDAVSGLLEHSGVFLLSSPSVWKLWGTKLERSFHGHSATKRILFDDGERAKTLRTVERICRELARAGADRHSLIVALGGGVVGDVAGFVAASYARGIRLVHVPTTLMAQVDSAIGGKTGVNLPEGKNLVGAFHQPRLVIADPYVLRTLPERQFLSGLYEVIKYGVIGDAALFSQLESQMDTLRKRTSPALDPVIERCIAMKAEIVSVDERETTGERQRLNFGHTVGHALEAATGYRKFLHGEAVGWGMMAATEIAVTLKMLDAAEASRIVALILRVGRLPGLPGVKLGVVMEAMQKDKKARGGKLRFILPERIGRVVPVDDVPAPVVEQTIARLRRLKGT